MHRIIRTFVPVLIALVLTQFVPAPRETFAQSPPAAAELRISGDVSTSLVLTVADLKKMPRKTLSVVNPHDQKKETYEGVLLEDLLTKAGIPQGAQLRGASMATYVVAEATDG